MWQELLDRIRFEGMPSADFKCLFWLHECHVRTVPFENLNIQNNIPIELEISHLHDKIVRQQRGGFCYELNHLFYHLLKEIGFEVNMISARVYDEGEPGPEFDHMALLVAIGDKILLADVGFGDLFVTPVELKLDKLQHDGRNEFKLTKEKTDWILWMAKEGSPFEKRYQFSTVPRSIDEFHDQCQWKQYSPDSYFVKNMVVSLPTSNGRKSIFNEKYVVNEGGKRNDVLIADPAHLGKLLSTEFNLHL